MARIAGEFGGCAAEGPSFASDGRAGFQPCRKVMRAERVPMRSFTRSKFSLCDAEIRNQRSQNLLK